MRRELSLAEADGEAFAGDGVGGAGGIAEQSDGVGGDAMEFAVGGDGAALLGDGLNAVEAACYLGELVEDVGAIAAGVARDVDDADAVGSDGGDVELAAAAPVDFDEVAPGRDAVVIAKAIAERALASCDRGRPTCGRRKLARRPRSASGSGWVGR